MFPFEEFWGAVLGVVIGGVIIVVLLKLLENKGTGLRDTGAEKLPQEHDERF